jgi:hypothetical protein
MEYASFAKPQKFGSVASVCKKRRKPPPQPQPLYPPGLFTALTTAHIVV